MYGYWMAFLPYGVCVCDGVRQFARWSLLGAGLLYGFTHQRTWVLQGDGKKSLLTALLVTGTGALVEVENAVRAKDAKKAAKHKAEQEEHARLVAAASGGGLDPMFFLLILFYLSLCVYACLPAPPLIVRRTSFVNTRTWFSTGFV